MYLGTILELVPSISLIDRTAKLTEILSRKARVSRVRSPAVVEGIGYVSFMMRLQLPYGRILDPL
jgi:hypothetical protein